MRPENGAFARVRHGVWPGVRTDEHRGARRLALRLGKTPGTERAHRGRLPLQLVGRDHRPRSVRPGRSDRRLAIPALLETAQRPAARVPAAATVLRGEDTPGHALSGARRGGQSQVRPAWRRINGSDFGRRAGTDRGKQPQASGTGASPGAGCCCGIVRALGAFLPHVYAAWSVGPLPRKTAA